MNPLGLRARDGRAFEGTTRSRSFAASGSAPLAERALLWHFGPKQVGGFTRPRDFLNGLLIEHHFCPFTAGWDGFRKRWKLMESTGNESIRAAKTFSAAALLSPMTHDLARFTEAPESVLVQALVAELAIEALDIGVLGRLAGLDKS
jgi:hypothetical protein